MTADATNDRYKRFSIELDCAPFNGPRPKDLIDGVLRESGLTSEDFTTAAPFFGHQTWVLKEGDEARDARFTEHRAAFEARIRKLYSDGYIRFGSW